MMDGARKTFSRGDRVVLITCYDSSLILENISMAEVGTFNDGVCVCVCVCVVNG